MPGGQGERQVAVDDADDDAEVDNDDGVAFPTVVVVAAADADCFLGAFSFCFGIETVGSRCFHGSYCHLFAIE